MKILMLITAMGIAFVASKCEINQTNETPAVVQMK